MSKIKMVTMLTALTAILLFVACGEGNRVNDGEITLLRMATLVDDDNPEAGIVFEAFRAGLEAHIGIPVQHIEGATRLAGIEAMRAGNLEMMWSSPAVYILAQQATEVERLAVTDSPTAINKTVFITSRDDIHSEADLQGRNFAFISSASTSGFMYPMYHLMNMFDMDRDGILMDFFGTVAYSGSQNASVMGVLHGDFDAAAVGNINLRNMISAGVVNEDDIRIIGSTEIIPFPGYVAAGHLPPELRQQIREFILAFDNQDYFAERFNDPNARFVMPVPAQIQHLASMAIALDIDLANE